VERENIDQEFRDIGRGIGISIDISAILSRQIEEPAEE